MKNQQFKDKLSKINKTIESVDSYINSQTKITFKCLTCDNQWLATPNNILRGRGCPECAIKSGKYKGNGKNEYINEIVPMENAEFIKRIKSVNSTVTPLEPYVKSSVKIKFKCETCNHTWKSTPNNILRGRGCPHCKIKYGEFLVEEWLNMNNIIFETQKTFDGLKYKYKLRVDFYIPDLNCIIEVDGEQHRRSIPFFGGVDAFKLNQLKDNLKNQYCQDNNIQLIRLEYEGMKIQDFTAELDKLNLLLE